MKAVDLTSFYLFNKVSAEVINKILPEYSVQTIPPGKHLIRKDFLNTSLFLLLKGEVEIYLDEEDKPLKVIKADEAIGEISMIDHSFATASAITLCECEVLILNEKLVWEFVEQSHVFAINFLNHISNRFRSVNSQVVSSIKKQRIIEQKSLIDDLTNLLNRGWMNKYFDTVLNACKQENQPFSYFMIDLDFFKIVNDNYGHLVGDFVLQETAELIKNLSRVTDYVVRYGGEEMAILLPNTEALDALGIAERIRHEIELYLFEYEEGKTLTISASIGIASLTDDESSVDLIKLADAALYYAKSHGRNQIKFNDGSLGDFERMFALQ